MDGQPKLRSTDLYEDTTVEILTSEKSDFKYKNGMVIFERPITEKVLKAIDEYNAGVKINVLLFSQTLKRRRAEILIAKREMGRQK